MLKAKVTDSTREEKEYVKRLPHANCNKLYTEDKESVEVLPKLINRRQNWNVT